MQRLLFDLVYPPGIAFACATQVLPSSAARMEAQTSQQVRSVLQGLLKMILQHLFLERTLVTVLGYVGKTLLLGNALAVDVRVLKQQSMTTPWPPPRRARLAGAVEAAGIMGSNCAARLMTQMANGQTVPQGTCRGPQIGPCVRTPRNLP